MDRARLHEGIRRMRFTDVLDRSERSELSQMEAAELLGISERTFRRWRDRYRDSGQEGLADRRLTPSLRRAPVEMSMRPPKTWCTYDSSRIASGVPSGCEAAQKHWSRSGTR